MSKWPYSCFKNANCKKKKIITTTQSKGTHCKFQYFEFYFQLLINEIFYRSVLKLKVKLEREIHLSKFINI